MNQSDRTVWVEQIADTHFGDADLNGMVEFDDFVLLSNAFNQESGWASGDFDGSGTTDFDDFEILAANFGATRETSQNAAVPEPSGALLACVSTMCLALRRLAP